MSTENSLHLLNEYASALANVASSGWEKIVVYKEMLRESDGHLRNAALEECWSNGKVEYELKGSAEAYNLLERLHLEHHSSGNAWVAFLFTLSSNGKYLVNFFYEGTPLLNGNYTAAEERITKGHW